MYIFAYMCICCFPVQAVTTGTSTNMTSLLQMLPTKK